MDIRQFSLLSVIAATILTCGKCQMDLNETLCQLLEPQPPGGVVQNNDYFIGSLSADYSTGAISVFAAGSNDGMTADSVILQIRRTDQNCPVGTFLLNTDHEASGLTGYPCGAANNTVVAPQTRSLSPPILLSWTPPSYNAGNLQVVGRFVRGVTVVNQAAPALITPALPGPVQTIVITACPPDGSGSTFTPPNCIRGGSITGPAVCTQTGDTVECTCMDCNTVSCSFTVAADCSTNPCLNGGSCVDTPTSFICFCLAGFTGTTCEDVIPVCSPDTCDNGGTCVIINGAFSCICLPGFTGPTCQDLIQVCNPNPCDNGATCLINGGAFSCICLPGFTGLTCDVPVVVGPACLPNPCTGGAECRPDAGLAGYTCHSSVGVPCLPP